MNFTKVLNSISPPVLYLVGTGGTMLVPLLLLPFLTRALTPADYGLVALSNVLGLILNGLTNVGLNVSFERNFFEYNTDEEVCELLYSILSYSIVIACFCSVLIYYSSDYLSNFLFHKIVIRDLIILSYLSQFSQTTISYFNIYFRNKHNSKIYVTIQLVITLLSGLGTVYLVIWKKIGPSGILLSPFVAHTLVFLLLITIFLRRQPYKFCKKKLMTSLKDSYPLIPTTFVGVLSSHVDKLILNLVGSVSEVGIYAVAQRFSSIASAVMNSLENSYSPVVMKKMFAGKECEKLRRERIGYFLTPYVFITLLICICMSMLSDEVVRVFSSKDYYDSINLVSVMSIYVGILFFRKHKQLIFAKEAFKISVIIFFGVGLNALLNYLFIKNYGILGVAWATVLSGLIVGFIHFYFSQKAYRIMWEYRKVLFMYSFFILTTLIVVFLRNEAVSYLIIMPIRVVSVLFFVVMGWIFCGRELKNILKARF